MKGNNKYGRFKWANVFTSEQEKEMIEATLYELKNLLTSPAVSNITDHIVLGEKRGEKLILDNKGFHESGKPWSVKEEKYPGFMRDFKVEPANLCHVKKLIETPLARPKRKK